MNTTSNNQNYSEKIVIDALGSAISFLHFMKLLHEQGHEFSVKGRIAKIRTGTQHFKLNTKGVGFIAAAFQKWEGSLPSARDLSIRILWIHKSGFTQDFPLSLKLCRHWTIPRFAKLFQFIWSMPCATPMTAEQLSYFLCEPAVQKKTRIARQPSRSTSLVSHHRYCRR